jgi:hypothetical protein
LFFHRRRSQRCFLDVCLHLSNRDLDVLYREIVGYYVTQSRNDRKLKFIKEKQGQKKKERSNGSREI